MNIVHVLILWMVQYLVGIQTHMYVDTAAMQIEQNNETENRMEIICPLLFTIPSTEHRLWTE